MTTTTRPTLHNSCAWAATAAEARFRIDARPQPVRSTCVVALDAGAITVVRDLAGQPWLNTRFLTYATAADAADLEFGVENGGTIRLGEGLTGTDFMLMVATANDGADAATAIGAACTLRGIMTAAVVLGDPARVAGAVSALRPHARVLLVTNDRQDVAELMAAVGA